MRRSLLIVLAIVTVSLNLASAQQPVNPRFTYHRAVCVVPLTGTGQDGDPVRPDHVPLQRDGLGSRDNIIGFYQETSDDGKWALVEFVAAHRSVLLPILADDRPGVWCAEKGRVPRDEIERHFRLVKKNIDLDRFGAVAR